MMQGISKHMIVDLGIAIEGTQVASSSSDDDNIDQVMNYYKLTSHLDLLFKIATKNLDLKELKLFQVIGEKIEAPRPVIIA